MKKQTILFAAALLTAGTLLTACSNDDMAVENPIEQTNARQMTFTATINAKGGTTRSVSESGVTAWVENEKIGVYYQKTDNSYATATANVDAVNAGAATISATLTDAKDGGTVKFVYPATLLDATNGDLDATKLAAQHGTIADISANFDAATGSGTLITNGTTCGTSANVTMTNQVLIGKFTPQIGDTPINEIQTLTVSDGTNTYTVTPTSGTFGTDGIYVAMLPVADKEVIITATTTTDTYGYAGQKITLAKGKLYNNLALAMGKYFDLASASFAGDYDAYIFQSNPATATSNTITIGAGRKVILSGVNISAGDNNAIVCSGSANIVISGSNTVTGNSTSKAVIKAGPAGSTLTFSGTGSLDATQSWDPANGACIGCDRKESCGNITITGGTITATMSGIARGAAIGSAICEFNNSSCGNITITGGTVTATSTDGAGIGTACNYGSGYKTSCGNITITGGTVTATSIDGAGIGSGCAMHAQPECGNIEITGGTVSAQTSGNRSCGAGIGAGGGGKVGTITISGTANVEAQSKYNGAGIGGSCMYSNINSSFGNILITGSANVTATGGERGAGIGSGGKGTGGNQGDYGNITIETTGTVNATGGGYAPGIGAGCFYRCGTITITRGIITATGGTDAAGIGTGEGETDKHSICGSISITGGTVTANKGTDANYDIGKGNGGRIKDGESDGTVTIAASVTSSDGKHYTSGNYLDGYNKE